MEIKNGERNPGNKRKTMVNRQAEEERKAGTDGDREEKFSSTKYH